MSERAFGRGDKPLAELSDAELEEELRRRRRRRAGQDEQPSRPSPSRRIAQLYANLELREGASVEEVRASYQRLMAKYHPDRHANDPERHRAATKLAAQLTEAYRGVLDHLGEPE